MSGEDISALVIGFIVIIIAINILKAIIIWLYETFKIIARIGVGIAGMVSTQLITQSMFGIGFTDFTWGSIGTAVVLALLFPDAGGD